MADSPTLADRARENIEQALRSFQTSSFADDRAEYKQYITDTRARITEYEKDEQIIALATSGATLSGEDVLYLAERLAEMQRQLAVPVEDVCPFDCSRCHDDDEYDD